MSMRGVRKPGTLTVTSAVRGIFKDNAATRAEAMAFIGARRAAALSTAARTVRRFRGSACTVQGLMFRWATIAGPVMGVVNVTPDSFSDGGRFVAPEAAVAHARAPRRRRRRGARHRRRVDPSGRRAGRRRDRARPGDPGDRRRSRAPSTVPISVDTTKAAVADAALRAGATIVNDVSAGTADAEMLGVVGAARRRLRRDAHAGRAADDAGATRTTTTSSARSPRSSRPASTRRAPPASPTTR